MLRGASPPEVAARLGIHRAQLDELLRRHGLVSDPRSFAIALPGQMQVEEMSTPPPEDVDYLV
jgi:hypothetical protein